MGQLRSLFYLLLLWMSVFVAGKAAFVSLCTDGMTVRWTDAWAVFVHGWLMDLSMTAYLLLVPWLCLWLSSAWRRMPVRRVLAPYHAVVAFIVVTCLVVDVGLYPFWQFKLDATIFNYIDSPRNALASVSVGFVVGRVVALLVAVVLVTWMADRIVASCVHRVPARRRASWLVHLAFLLSGGLLFVALRGGVRESTMNVGNAYFCDRQFLNHAAVNPVFSLMSSTLKNERFGELYETMSDEEARGLFTSAWTSGAASSDGVLTDTLLRTSRPNILLIFWEGCGGQLTSIIGHRQGVTPCLDSLACEAVFFSRFYANSYRTDRGVLSTLSGHVSYPCHSLMKMAERASRLPSVASSLRDAGYTTHFTYGGDINFTNMKGYLLATGYEAVTADDDFDLKARNSAKWGVSDSIVFDRMAERIAQAGEGPWMETVLTLSSHEPWDVPGADPQASYDEQKHRAFAYTDRQLGRFIDRLRNLPQWDSLLVVILPDHGLLADEVTARTHPAFFHIPMVWTGGAVAGPRQISQLMMQSDLPATLLGQMGLPHGAFTWSRNVLSTAYTCPFVYATFNDGFVVADTTGMTIYDNIAAQSVYEEGEDVGTHRRRLGQALLQLSYDELSDTR